MERNGTLYTRQADYTANFHIITYKYANILLLCTEKEFNFKRKRSIVTEWDGGRERTE
jgi:hypothetical protein